MGSGSEILSSLPTLVKIDEYIYYRLPACVVYMALLCIQLMQLCGGFWTIFVLPDVHVWHFAVERKPERIMRIREKFASI